MHRIDLNCDLGESFGVYTIGHDAEILPLVSSVNIACGFHAGDPVHMAKTVDLALEHGVAIGAHPGFPDLAGFGRRPMNLSPDELRYSLIYQIAALDGIVRSKGSELHHVKVHGALYNMAAQNYDLAKITAEAVYNYNPDLLFFGLANSSMLTAADDIGLQTVSEAFADRAYNNDGSLLSRDIAGAVITDINLCVQQVLALVQTGTVQSCTGQAIPLTADSLCVHGDNAHALALAQSLRSRLTAEGITIQAPKQRNKNAQ